MTTFIKLAGVNPPASRPRVDLPDLVMPEKGALFLLDATHPVKSWASGVPEDNSYLPNLAGDSLASLSNRSGAVYLDSRIQNTNLAAANITAKRTSKGGLNAARIANGSNGGVRIRWSLGLMEYLLNNTGHKYYVSSWSRILKSADTTYAHLALGASTVRDTYRGYLAIVSNANTNYPANDAANPARNMRIGQHREPNNTRNITTTVPPVVAATTPFPFYASIGVNGYSVPEEIDQTAEAALDSSRVWGVGSPFTPFGMGNSELIDQTFYRAYVEDLTVSGRTYAEVDALDYALYQKEVMTSGGRYYNDA